MSRPYAYTPYIWPMLVTAALVVDLGVYAWRHRHVPAATPFALLTLLWALWILGSALELAALDEGTKFFWFQVQAVLKLPTLTCELIFVLAYGGLDKWLTRTTLSLLAFPCVILPVLIVTNRAHDLTYAAVWFGQDVGVALGPALWAAGLYISFLFLLQIGVLIWLGFRFPLYRWPLALILGAQLVERVAATSDALGLNPVAPLDAAMLFSSLTAVVYFLALFRFRLFDLIPVAHGTVIEQMREGMLVLDAANRIVELNPAARALIGMPTARLIGHDAVSVLASFPSLIEVCRDPALAGTTWRSVRGKRRAGCRTLAHSGGALGLAFGC